MNMMMRWSCTTMTAPSVPLVARFRSLGGPVQFLAGYCYIIYLINLTRCLPAAGNHFLGNRPLYFIFVNGWDPVLSERDILLDIHHPRLPFPSPIWSCCWPKKRCLCCISQKLIVCDVCRKMYIFVHLIRWKVERGALLAIPLTSPLNPTFQSFSDFSRPCCCSFPGFSVPF